MGLTESGYHSASCEHPHRADIKMGRVIINKPTNRKETVIDWGIRCKGDQQGHMMEELNEDTVSLHSWKR